jgi:hypothetical protein
MSAAVFLTLVLAQGPPVAEAAETARLDRIRRALAEAPAITVLPATRTEGTVFRITVFGRKPDRPLWVDWSVVPAYVRPRFPSYHFEFLQQVTPEEFRAGTLYPQGIPIDRVAQFLVKQIKAANRRGQEAKAKEEVRQALEELLACRANPARPGC